MYYFAVLAFLTGLLNLFLGFYSYSVSAKKQVNLLFLILSSLFATWSFFYAFVYIAPTKEDAWLFYNISSIGWVCFPPVLLHFTLLIRNKDFKYKKLIFALIYLPAIVFQSKVYFDYLLTVDLVRAKLGWIHVFNKNDNIFVAFFISYLLIYVIVAIYNIVMYGRESVYKNQKKQANALLISSSIVTLFGALSDIFLPRFLNNETVPAVANIFTSFWVIGSFIAVVRYKMMVLTTSIATETIVTKIKDIIVLFSPQYRILEVNKRVEELLGYKNEELIDKKINILFENSFKIDFELVKLNSKNVEEVNIETKFLTKDKKLFPVDISISAIRDKKFDIIGCVLTAHDLRDIYQLKEEIEEREALTEELKNSEQKFKDFLEFLPVAVCEVSLESKVTYINLACKKLFEATPEDIANGINIFSVIDENDHERLKINYFRTLNNMREFEEANEYTAISLKGKKFPIITYTNTINKQYGTSLRAIIVDNSERKNYEQSLKKAKEIAESANKAKSSFIANTSHEIRTPLNAMIGYTNLLLKQNLSEQQERYIKNIKTSGDNLLGIINDILDHSKIQSVKLVIQNVEFEVKKVIENIVDAINVKAHEKNISLILHFDKNIPEILIGDPVRIGQVLNNLIGNALKFTEKGGVVNVNVLLTREILGEVEIRFTIEDTGIGIPNDKLESIFESFNQVDYNTTRKYGGTGLGLSIVKQIIEAHNSKIEVQSELNKGTKFSFNIVFRKSQSERIEFETQSEEFKLCERHPQIIHILLAEDNVTNQEIIVDTILAWRNTIKIDIADNGKIAVEKLKNFNYDLLLLDMQMPEMDGYDVAKFIRNEMEMPQRNIPIFAMTANAMKEEIKKCLDLGMNEYFSKPFSPNDLYNKIRLYTCIDVVKKRCNNEMVDYTCLFCKAEFTNQKEIITNQNNHKSDLKLIDLSHFEKIYKNDYKKIGNIISKILDEIPVEIIELIKAVESENWLKVKTHSHTIKTKMLYIGATKSHEISKQIEIESSTNPEHQNIINLVCQLDENWNQVKKELKSLNI